MENVLIESVYYDNVVSVIYFLVGLFAIGTALYYYQKWQNKRQRAKAIKKGLADNCIGVFKIEGRKPFCKVIELGNKVKVREVYNRRVHYVDYNHFEMLQGDKIKY